MVFEQFWGVLVNLDPFQTFYLAGFTWAIIEGIEYGFSYFYFFKCSPFIEELFGRILSFQKPL